MRYTLIAALAMAALTTTARAQELLADSTLRIDYVFSGDNRSQAIHLSQMSVTPGWYGRRVNMDQLLLQGNGQITLTDTTGACVLYRHSFSTLFQEWQTTEEATRVNKSFENVFLVPMPRVPCLVTVTLTDTHNRESCRFTHRVDPADILIRPKRATTPWRYVRQGGDSRGCIDIAFVAEGYRADEMDVFYADCQAAIDAMASHEPFASTIDRFNFVGVACPSAESGVSVPHEGVWVNTALRSHYDTFYSQRYLTVPSMVLLNDVLDGIPYEHIIVLANTERYGGGGIFNAYLVAATHNAKTRPVTVHEFGHSFGGLGDEYFYDDQYETMYPADAEPWEPNLTTQVDFASKWADMAGKDGVGLVEGGGYQSKGVWRPTPDCRMKTNEFPVFCPVCERAVRRIIDYQTR